MCAALNQPIVCNTCGKTLQFFTEGMQLMVLEWHDDLGRHTMLPYHACEGECMESLKARLEQDQRSHLHSVERTNDDAGGY